MKRIFKILLTALLSIPVSSLHAEANPGAIMQERRDTVCVLEPVVAFDLPWLAKYYGFDWSAGPVASGQASGDSLVTPAGDSKAGAERRNACLPGKPKMLTATPSPCGPTCCAGPRLHPTLASNGASARPWVSW